MGRKTGVMLSYVLMAVEVLTTLWVTPYMLRALGEAEFGVYRLTASVGAYLMLLDLGVGNSVVRFVARYRLAGETEKCRTFLGAATVYYGVVAAVCLGAGSAGVGLFPRIFAAGLTGEEIRLGQVLLALTAVNAAVTLAAAGFRNTVTAWERFDVSRGVAIAGVVARGAISVGVLKMGLGSVAVAGGNLAVTAASAACYAVFVVKKLHIRPAFHRREPALVREVWAYSSLILLQMVATQINAYMGSVLLGIYAASAAVVISVYSVGQQLAQYFQAIGLSVTGVMMPGVVRLVESGAGPERLEEEMLRVGRILLMLLGMIWAVFFACGREFIRLWVGGGMEGAYWVALALLTAYTLVLPQTIGTQMLWAKNAHREQSVLKLAVVVPAVAGTVALIQWNALYGAAIGTALSLLLGDVAVADYMFDKKLGIRLGRYYRELLRGIGPGVAITAVVGWGLLGTLAGSWATFLLRCAILVAVYGACMLGFGMNSAEKRLLAELLPGRKKEEK